MSTPTQKHTASRKKIRRGQLKAKKASLVKCPKCKQPVRPHVTCANCGYYKGKQVVKVRVPKKLRKKGQNKKSETAK